MNRMETAKIAVNATAIPLETTVAARKASLLLELEGAPALEVEFEVEFEEEFDDPVPLVCIPSVSHVMFDKTAPAGVVAVDERIRSAHCERGVNWR